MQKLEELIKPSKLGRVINIDADRCTGCNLCVEACRRDVLVPNPKRKQPPLVLYPEDCWYCGCCAQECTSKAIRIVYPLYQRIAVVWKEKDKDEIFYLKGIKMP